MSDDKEIKELKDAADLIREAMNDLEDYFCKIKHSKRILQYKENGKLTQDIILSILAGFVAMQITEFGCKAKMVHDATQMELPRDKRILYLSELFQYHYKHMMDQYETFVRLINDNK